jgi:multidrug resistance efflux pump
VSTAERDHASTAYQVAQAQVELARVALAYTEIRAPIRSTVIRKLRDVGEKPAAELQSGQGIRIRTP